MVFVLFERLRVYLLYPGSFSYRKRNSNRESDYKDKHCLNTPVVVFERNAQVKIQTNHKPDIQMTGILPAELIWLIK